MSSSPLSFKAYTYTDGLFAWRLAQVVTLLFILSACGGGGVSPTVAVHMASKANMFADVAIVLFAQEPNYWGQALRSLYYCALTLGRLKNLSALTISSSSFHKKVWQHSELKIRRYFGETMKEVRTRHDYDCSAQNSSVLVSDSQEFFLQGEPAFRVLLDQSKASIEKVFARCASNSQACQVCKDAASSDCLKVIALAQIYSLSSKMVKLSDTFKVSPRLADK
jgi:hypothetical protein